MVEKSYQIETVQSADVARVEFHRLCKVLTRKQHALVGADCVLDLMSREVGMKGKVMMMAEK